MMLKYLPLAMMVGLWPGAAVVHASPPPAPQLIAQQVQLYGTVIPNELNVRDGAGTDRRVLYVLHRDAVVRITGQFGDGSDSWYRVVPMTSGYPQTEGWVSGAHLKVRDSQPSGSYYDIGYQAGLADAQAGRNYDPVGGSRDLPTDASRAYSRGYGDGYTAGRPGNSSGLQRYYDDGYQHGLEDGRAGRTYDPVAGSHGLPANLSREYTRGYADGYGAGRP